MRLQKALFLGGALFLLAACSDATAPTSQLRTKSGVPMAAAKAPTGGTEGGILECRSGYNVFRGDKEVCADDLVIQPLP